jgi:hypothetical protein
MERKKIKKKYQEIIEAFENRLNIFAGFLLNGLILWDFQCLIRLESWKAETAGQLPKWLETIGEICIVTGAKLFLSRLADLNGTGIIATHDLSLCKMENEFPGKIFNKCFEVEIEGENILFDYKLRDGITRHMNAGLLMRQMGII